MVEDLLHLDVETRSAVDLRKTGAYAYFAHETTDLWCAAWAFNDEEPQIWLPGEPCPQRIVDHIAAGRKVAAWNSAFERICWAYKLVKKYGWPKAKLEQFVCTMAEAYAMNLPGKLEDAAPALGIDIAKDTEGHRLMLRMCRPRKTDDNGNPLSWWDDDEEKKQKLYSYCKQDVRVEQAIHSRVLRLRPKELEVFWLDARINDRGVHIDQEVCQAARRIVREDTKRLDNEMNILTNGEVSRCSNVKQLKDYINERGVEIDSVAKDVINDLLIMDLPPECEQALLLRKEAAKTSTAKIEAMLTRRDADGRMRGNLQYHGAGTGRWAARGAQLQNLPRPEIIKDGQDAAIEVIKYGSNVLVDLVYGKPLTVVADCIRGMITAGEGNELLSADFSNIEGRVTGWLSGQEDKLEAFRAFDAGTGPDLYLMAASGVYGVPVVEAAPHRHVGKVCELALGFQGGPGAFASMAKNYGLKIGELYEGIWERASSLDKASASSAFCQRGHRLKMTEEAWIAAELIKIAWRRKNNHIVAYWHEVEDAAYDALTNPGKFFSAGYVKYVVNGSFLWCRLPSGRALCYPYPKLVDMVYVEDDEGQKDTMTRYEAERSKKEITGNARSQLSYKSVDQYTRRWKGKAFYGGLGVENITQAVARDVMAEAMLRVESKGYKCVLTVHDEIVSEVPKGFGSLEEFSNLMTVNPDWAEGLPITAEGWQGYRYRK